MELIEKYFRDKVENVNFLEFKDALNIEAKNMTIKKDLPLPIILDDFIEGIKEGEVDEEIDLTYIIDGIIYIIGVDKEFPYIDEYKDILLNYDEDIVEYLLYESTKDIEKENYDNSAIKLRTLLTLDHNNIKGLFNYAVSIEGIAKKYMLMENEEKGQKFLKYSTKKLENILDIDKDFAPAYYKLGYHYKYMKQYLKANLVWQKFLPLGEDELLVQEVREEINIIEDDANLEAGLTYLNYNDYKKALDYLLKLIPDHEKSWSVNYFIGQAYSGLGQWDFAIEFLSNALEYNEEIDIYNELGIAYFNIGNIKRAVDIFNKGIKYDEDDYKLYFNRGLAYLQLEQYNEALKDIDKAYELNPGDDNIRSQKDILESLLYNN
ncbi:MAG TPA: tetratricopeptide repeat protein [Tissierellaceae bacterium]|nr:tetratricopeptide repeat protein [Tissierellaceae bacterium]